MASTRSYTPITREALVALGGVLEDDGMIRFGKEVAYEANGFWHYGLAHFRFLEDITERLRRLGLLKGEPA